MRHRVTGKTLGRTAQSRKALMRGLATNFFLAEKMETTEAKAKALRPIVEKYITTAKKGDLAARRRVAAYLYTPGAVKKLMDDIAPRYTDRPGGYTRITKTDRRLGDGAEMAVIELV